MLSKRALITLLLAGVLALTPALASAQITSGADDPDPSETKIGALASIGCGIMIKATIMTAGTQVGTIAGAVACCGYAMFDALFVEPCER